MKFGSGMAKGGIRPGMYVGTVTARSTGEPSRTITYTVAVQGPNGAIEFQGVQPPDAGRWTSFDPTLRLIPFEVGRDVVVLAKSVAGSIEISLGTFELPDHGACPSV
jgi:hypothetical protein